MNIAGIRMESMERKKNLTTEQLEDAARLKALYESKKKTLGITQYTIADELGITQGAVGHYFNGRNALNVEMASGFAKILGVPVSEFSPSIAAKVASQAESLDGDSLEYAGKLRDGIIPVVGDAVLSMDGLIDMVEFHAGWLRFYSSDSKAYAVRVRGDSMWPRMQSGEFVVIEPGTKVHPGDEVFVRTKDGHNMIKIMNMTRDGDYQFVSVNSEHKPITIAADHIDKIHFVSGIIKATRFISLEDTSRVDMFGGPANLP